MSGSDSRRTTIDDLLAEARERIDRLSPAEAAREAAAELAGPAQVETLSVVLPCAGEGACAGRGAFGATEKNRCEHETSFETFRNILENFGHIHTFSMRFLVLCSEKIPCGVKCV